MKQFIIHSLTFMAIVLPALYFLVLDDRTEKKRSGDASLPPLFRLLNPMADFMETLGIGNFFRKLFAGHSITLQKKLHFAGLNLTPGTVYCVQALLLTLFALLAGGIAMLLTDEENRISIPIAGAIGALVGWALPGITIGNLAQQRQLAILRAIPYSIDLIASAMRGGLDFTAAVRFYVKLGVSGPLTEEYSQMLREMELGVIRTAALQNMADRIQIKEFTSFAAAVALGTELGAPLTETMEIQGEEMRKARFALAECKAQRAPSLMLLPMALFILPAVFITILTPVFLKMKEAGVPLF